MDGAREDQRVAEKKSKNTGGLEASGNNINQIRDILIGPFQRDQQAHVARLEQRLERLSSEAAERSERSAERLQKSLDDAMATLENRLSECIERLSKVEAGARRETEELGKSLTRDMRDLDQTLRREIETLTASSEKSLESFRRDSDKALLALRDEKTSRADLGDYLTEVGMRLKGEQTLSALESSLKDALNVESDD